MVDYIFNLLKCYNVPDDVIEELNDIIKKNIWKEYNQGYKDCLQDFEIRSGKI